MGEHDVDDRLNDRQLRAFMRALLEDVHVLEAMLQSGVFERERRRIGAEQEMFLVGDDMEPAPVATSVLDRAADPRLTTELARFNLEANASPRLFEGRCLSEMEQEIGELVRVADDAARTFDARVLLTGILPTLRQHDLGLDNMTPNPRYHALNRAMTRLRGGEFHVVIKGLDELETRHDNVMLESCNTSFQIHFQVAPHEFAKLYNIAQAITAPVLAAAVNSPLLLGRRLWNETRVALFQRSVDARSTVHQARGLRPRVSFGEDWVEASVLEIFREDIARFRVVLATELDEDPGQVWGRGAIPKLTALRLHNGTVYRWNRACYGISENGKPHLRIENRVLPAGPSIVDEIANATFFFGLMSGLTAEHDDIARVMRFDHAKDNFFAAARHGLKAQFTWVAGETVSARELILDRLLPLCRRSLIDGGLDGGDVDRYLAIIDERVRTGRTGAQWTLESLAAMGEQGTADIRERSLARAMLRGRDSGEPVHRWPLAEIASEEAWSQGFRTVGQFMSTDLFTVRPQDLVDLAASVMDWEHIRHVPVEDDAGRLVGLVTHRTLLRLMARGEAGSGREPVAVRDIMKADPVTVEPSTPTIEAIRLMKQHKVGCLPVVDQDKLVGIITESDLVEVSAHLLENFLREK